MSRKKIQVGDKVDYHSVIGQEVTSTGHVVTELYPKPNNFGYDCAMITGKAGIVALRALTHTKPPSKTWVCPECHKRLRVSTPEKPVPFHICPEKPA